MVVFHRYGRFALVMALVMLTILVGSGATHAQTDRRCFAETGFCIEGRIRAFWEHTGGLPVFGYPISDQHEEMIEGRAVQVQWFERNRLELHPENAPPYDVLLGRIGGEVVDVQGHPPREAPQEGCLYVEETGFNVCGDILAAWQSQGLELDNVPGTTYQESLALFGYPLTGQFATTLSDGHQYTVQWFERARFELHPELVPPSHVLLGRLGAEVQGEPVPPATDQTEEAKAIIRAYIGEGNNVIEKACMDENFAVGYVVVSEGRAIWIIIGKKGDTWEQVISGSWIDPDTLTRLGVPQMSCFAP